VRLKGKGIAGGNQVIVVKVVVPAATEGRARELFEEIAKLYPQDPRAGSLWK
jgi:hypothetical protein